MLEVSGEVRPLIGVRGLDGMGDSMSECERRSDARLIAALLDATDDRREIAGDGGWDIRGEEGFAEDLKTGGLRRRSRSDSEVDGSGEGVAKKSSEVS
jgi:hypothetical protein